MKELDYFSARHHALLITGRVQNESGCFYLCQNTLNGRECRHKLGFNHSWNIVDGTNLQKYGITDFKIITQAQHLRLMKKLIPVELGEFLGFEVIKSGDIIIFGCGSVKATVEQVLAFEKLIKNKDFILLAPILANILDNIDVNNVEVVKDVKKLVKTLNG